MIVFDLTKLFSMFRGLFKPAVVEPAASMFDFSTKAYRNEAGVFLDTVWQGLEYLCEQVERAEQERTKPTKNFIGTDFGNQPGDPMVCKMASSNPSAISASGLHSSIHRRISLALVFESLHAVVHNDRWHLFLSYLPQFLHHVDRDVFDVH